MEELDVKGYKLYPGFAQSTNKQKASPMTHVSTIYDGDKNLQDIIDEILDEKNSIPEVDRIEIEINPEDWVEKEDSSFGYDYTDPLLTDKVMTEVAADRVNMDLIVKDKIRWMLTEDVVGNTVTIYSEKRPTVKLKLQIIRYTKYFLINLAIKESDWTGNDKLKKYVYQNPDIFAKYLALFRMNRENIRLFLNNNYAITNTTDGQIEIATDNAVTLNAQSVFLYTDLIGNIPNGDGNVNPEPPTTPIPPDDHDCIKTRFSKEIIYESESNKYVYVLPDVFMGIFNDNTHLNYVITLHTSSIRSYIRMIRSNGNPVDYTQDMYNMALYSPILDIYNDYSVDNFNFAKISGVQNYIFIAAPGALMFFSIVGSGAGNIFRLDHIHKVSTIPYNNKTNTTYGTTISDTLFVGEFYNDCNIYILYRSDGKLKLTKVVRNTGGSQILSFSDGFNITLASQRSIQDTALFEYNSKVFAILPSPDNVDSEHLFKISETGSIERKYKFDTSQFSIKSIYRWGVEGNILYTIFYDYNSETRKYSYYVVRLNLDTFTVIDTKPLLAFDGTDQPTGSGNANNMYISDGHIFTTFIDIDDTRYIVKLSPTNYNIEDKIEISEDLSDTDDNNVIKMEPYISGMDGEKSIGLYSIKSSGNDSHTNLKIMELKIIKEN